MAIEFYQLSYQYANHWSFTFLDNLEINMHVKDINIPFPKLEYESVGRKHFINEIQWEDNVSITFRENTRFSSYRYFDSWMNAVMNPTNKTIRKQLIGSTGNLSLIPDLSAKYKSAILIFDTPTIGIGIGSDSVSAPTGIFQFTNLSPVGFSEITVNNDSGDPLEFTFDMKVESVKFMSSAGLIGDQVQEAFQDFGTRALDSIINSF